MCTACNVPELGPVLVEGEREHSWSREPHLDLERTDCVFSGQSIFGIFGKQCLKFMVPRLKVLLYFRQKPFTKSVGKELHSDPNY